MAAGPAIAGPSAPAGSTGPAARASDALPKGHPTAPSPTPSAVEARVPTGVPHGTGAPRIALVIDDCGQRLDLMQRAVRSRVPLTFAVIPRLPRSRESAELAWGSGHEVIVHQPMEPESGDENPGEGAITVGMSRARIRAVLQGSLDGVPHAVGMNNHMGSRATSDPRLMADVLGVLEGLRPEGFYFLDSRTSAATVALQAARTARMPAAERSSPFLDDDLSPAAIQGELAVLMARATADGQAVGIGHLKPETLAVLEAVLPGVPEAQYRFVFLSELVR